MIFFSSIDYNDFLWSLERSLVRSPVVFLKLHIQPTQNHELMASFDQTSLHLSQAYIYI